MKGKRKYLVGVVSGMAVLAFGATAVAAPADQGRVVDRQAVQRAVDKIAASGAVLGVQVRITDGRRQFTARGGVAELGGNRPVPVDGRFRVGSITKTFVSTVTLQLVGEDKVGLDEPVSTYLPGLLPDGDTITVRMLLQHTSGLANYTTLLGQDFESIRYRHWEPGELVALSTARPLDFPPGTAWEYSNTNYVVLGMLVERVTGRSLESGIRQRILHPLGLGSSLMPGDRTSIPGPHARGYYPVEDRIVDITELNPSVVWAAGDLISTTADLDRFLDALLDGRLLKPAQQAELTKDLPITGGYGLGIFRLVASCGVATWGHDGILPGYVSFLTGTTDTRTRLALSLTTEGGQGDGAGLIELLDAVFC